MKYTFIFPANLVPAVIYIVMNHFILWVRKQRMIFKFWRASLLSPDNVQYCSMISGTWCLRRRADWTVLRVTVFSFTINLPVCLLSTAQFKMVIDALEKRGDSRKHLESGWQKSVERLRALKQAATFLNSKAEPILRPQYSQYPDYYESK